MGSGASANTGIACDNPIRVINFEDFKKCGSFPRYPTQESMCANLNNIDRDSSLFVFISHGWLRASDAASGWDPKTCPHPDTETNDNYRLCVTGITRIMEQLAPGMTNCYIWMDFGCVDQDKLVCGEVRQFIEIIKCADCMFTPIYGTAEVKTNRVTNWYEEYKADAWNAEKTGYTSRAWCRAEMLFTATVPIYSCPESRKNKFAGDLHKFVANGARPHMLYGNREERACGLPTVLSPLDPALFSKMNPINGQMTNPDDRDRIKELVQALKPYAAVAQKNPSIAALRNDLRQGRDTKKYENGDVYTGEFVNDKRNTVKGNLVYANGDVYEGEFRNDMRHGRGILKYENGDVYQGRFVDDLKSGKGILSVGADVYQCEFVNDFMNGLGRLKFGNGDVYEGQFTEGEQTGFGCLRFSDSRNNIYEGEFLNGLMHGKGKLRLADGNSYEGDYVDGVMTGKGKFIYADGNTYDGDWSDGMMNGTGVFTYSDGNVFSGQFEDGMMNGKGVMKFSDGCEYDGNFVDGAQSGQGKMVWPNGTKFDGEWQDDKMVSGVLSTAEEESYKADFSDGDAMVNGTRVYQVKLWNADGTVHKKSKFMNGKLLEFS